MKAVDIPTKFPIPFAASAGGGFIRPIPVASQISITAGAASLTDGFVPVNFQPIGAGGTPPFGQDMNGLMNQVTKWQQWQGAGGVPVFDPTYVTQISGYPQGATLASTTPGQFWLNTVDDNITNPDVSGVGWVAFATARQIQNQTFVYQVAGGTATALTFAPSPPPAALVAGQRWAFQLPFNIGLGATLNVTGASGPTGAKSLTYGINFNVQANDFLSGQILEVEYDGTVYQIVGGLGPAAIKNYSRIVNRTVVATPGAYSVVLSSTTNVMTGKGWGAGGGGGGGAGGTPGGAPSGGGSGAYGAVSTPVTPGATINGVVGAGGSQGVPAADGGPGGSTTIGIPGYGTIICGGGAGGHSANNLIQQNAVPGGAASGGDATSRNGSPGAQGYFSYNGVTAVAEGGLGGASPNGGTGGNAGAGNGNPGNPPGGGGGGGGGNAMTSAAGGLGSRGEVWIEQ